VSKHYLRNSNNLYWYKSYLSFFSSLLTVLLCIAIISTFVDIANKKSIKNEKVIDEENNNSSRLSFSMRILLSFSLIRNTKKLFLSNTYNERLSVIHGIRVLAITWILIGHIYLMQFFQIFHAVKRTMEEVSKLSWYRYQPHKLGSFLQVETFFLIG